MNYKVSVIMAAYNAEKTIGDSIQSVLNQTYDNYELLVVDDCSEDDTLNVIQRYAAMDSRVICLKNDSNSGVSLTRKKALDNASGDLIAVLDSDDLWEPDKLTKQIDLFRSKQADIVYSGSAFVDELGNRFSWTMEVPETVDYRHLLKQNVISNSSSLLRKDIYANNYVIGDGLHEDYALWLRLLKQGYKAYGVNEPLLVYRLGHNTKSSNKVKSAMMNWKTYRYVGINFFSSLYYMFCYFINGLKKYRNFN